MQLDTNIPYFTVANIKIPEPLVVQLQGKVIARIHKPLTKIFSEFTNVLPLVSLVPVKINICDISAHNKPLGDYIGNMRISGRIEFNRQNRTFSINLILYRFENDERDIQRFTDHFFTFYQNDIAFIYLKECLHLLNRDMENEMVYMNAAEQFCRRFKRPFEDKVILRQYINYALDFFVNNQLIN
ncbi:MAG TPA: hypothetical protein PKY81_15405, partial [bacterium]|nr:hypothetical protein [bacterium]